MGLIEFLEVVSSKIGQLKDFPGKSFLSKAIGVSGGTLEVEIFQNANAAGALPEGARVILVPVNGGRKSAVGIASHNYKITLSLTQGGYAIWATDASGENVKAKIQLNPDGKIEIDSDSDVVETVGGKKQSDATGKQVLSGTAIELNGNSKSFVTYSELNSALQSLVSSINTAIGTKQDGPGATPSLTLDISSAETSSIKTGG